MNNQPEDDDLDLGGCAYVSYYDYARFPADSTYTSYWYLVDDLRTPMQECFSLTDDEAANMSFMDLYGYCDIIQSDDFEPVDLGCTFTDQEYTWIDTVVYATLTEPMADPIEVQHMYVSKQLRGPLSVMDLIVQATIDGNLDLIPSLKMIMYSTHDWTVAQSILFFAADNGAFLELPFASQINIELHSDVPEGFSVLTLDDFWVEVRYNGMLYQFSSSCAVADKCTYAEFVAMLSDADGFIGTSTHYISECSAATSFNGIKPRKVHARRD
jgi:hypothetical protein